ncbi:MAG: glycosyltransferase family 2 protein [Firmicutes bacterium]|nr:glycosyltransferase family 2 protein [Bacillota bacterium]
MELIALEFVIVLVGMFVTAILFYRLPVIPDIKEDISDYPLVSIIIPARNEEANLPLLLSDLIKQTLPVYEIICVDDASEDSTAQIALEYGAKLLSLPEKPNEWTGKAWACQNGANIAKGELLLFLDADVRLGRDGIRMLLQAYLKEGCTVSVQPYHKTKKNYEQFSMLFNFVQIAANGTALPKQRSIGLYGPVILISRHDYLKIGGHEKQKKSVIEDIAIGLQLKQSGLSFRLFIGNKDVSFRMYSEGMRSLIQGWTKNIAAGAANTPAYIFTMVFLWITSLISVPVNLIRSAILMDWVWLVVYSVLNTIWVLILAVIAKRIGHFKVWAFIFYPVLMLVFVGVFTVSALKKLFGLKVTWKGRAIETGEKS